MIAEKKYLKPATAAEAIALAAKHPQGFRYLAGGTDVIVNKFQGNEESNCLIDITGIDEMKNVATDGDILKIGSLIRLDDLQKHEIIRQKFPALLEAAHQAASPMLRKTATIGGNILCENRCSFYNQSEWWREAVGYCLKCDLPAGKAGGDICIATGGKKACFSKFVSDTAPVLIANHALLEVEDETGTRKLPLESIYTGDGVNPHNLPKTALIKFILLSLSGNYKTVFKKLRVREAVDFTSLTTAVSQDDTGRIRVVLGGVDPKPVLVESSADIPAEKTIEQALKKSRVIDNDVYSRPYRREMIRIYLRSSLQELNIK